MRLLKGRREINGPLTNHISSLQMCALSKQHNPHCQISFTSVSSKERFTKPRMSSKSNRIFVIVIIKYETSVKQEQKNIKKKSLIYLNIM